MKNLITIMILFVGCATTPTVKSVVGSYEAKIGKFVFLENGKCQAFIKGEEKTGTWKLVKKEVHIKEVDIEEVTDILKIEPNGDFTFIAYIENGKRTELQKEVRSTFKKLKE